MTTARRLARSCPRCGQPLDIVKTAKSEYVRCSAYDDAPPGKCPHREPVPVHILLDRAGAPRLPGF